MSEFALVTRGNIHQAHQALGTRIKAKEPWSTTAQDIEYVQPILLRQSSVNGVKWIAQDVALLIGAVHACGGSIDMLSQAALQTSTPDPCTFLMKAFLVRQKQIRDLARRDL